MHSGSWCRPLLPQAVVLLMLLAVAVRPTPAARILVVAPYSSNSHNTFFLACLEHLAERNHTVTFITRTQSREERHNIKEVVVSTRDMFSLFPSAFTTFTLEKGRHLYEVWSTLCMEALALTQVQQVLRHQYDLVMMSQVSTDCFLPHFKQVPVIYMSPSSTVSRVDEDLAHSPLFPSMVPHVLMGQTFPLTFTDRLVNSLANLGMELSFYHYIIPVLERECGVSGLCPQDDLKQLRLNTSLIIINSVKTLELPARPYTPTVVHAGGIHCRPARPLPKDLEEWVSGAGAAGVVYFSLGSAVKSSSMPPQYREVLLKVFASLEQRVIWKWDQDQLEGQPPNVYLSKWLPQQDLLGHPQVRLFITQGGLLSAQEAAYHGVPLLGLPVHTDQLHNLKEVEAKGWGRLITWKELTASRLHAIIQSMLHNPKLSEVARWQGELMRDQPMAVGAWVTYWVEYVLRHRGAPHLRCPSSHMPWWQLYNVDVWVVVVVVAGAALILSLLLCCSLLRCVYRRCCPPRVPVSSHKNKHE